MSEYITGKHIFLQHPNMQQGDIEYYEKKKIFLEKSNLLSSKKISFRDIDRKEIEKSIYDTKRVIFEVTEKCNLNCVYCTFGELYNKNEKRIKEKRNLKKEDAIKLLEYLYPAWKEREQAGLPQKIMFGFYGGEPLMNISLIEAIVQWAKEHTTNKLTFGFTVTTNGLLLNKYMDFLVKYDFMIYISLDGNEENMSYRLDHKGENCFKRVFNNIMTFKKKYPVFFDKNVFFLTVLHNKNSVEHVLQFCMTHFNKIPICSRLNDSGINPKKRALFSEMYESIPVQLSKKTKKTMMQTGMGFTEIVKFLNFFSGFHFYDYNELLQKDEKNEIRTLPTGVCIPFSREIYMTINGNLYPCEKLDFCFVMGNIHDTHVLDAEQIAARYNQYFKNILPACSACERKFSCNKCLFNIDNIREIKPQCSNIMNRRMLNDTVSSTIASCKKHPALYRIIMKRSQFAL